MSTISIRLSEKEDLLVRNYAKMHCLSVSDLIRASVIEKIEDEIDLNKLTVPQLKELAAKREIDIDSDDKKQVIIDKIKAGA